MLYKERHPKYINARLFKTWTEESPAFDLTDPTTVLEKAQLTQVCPTCGEPLEKHGLYAGQLVCPGTYLLFTGTQITGLMTQQNFEALYIPIGEVMEG